MKKLSCIFLDLGGVVLSNGWDQSARKRAVEKFGLSKSDFEDRHRLVFEAYENGLLTFEQYLDSCVFHQKRSFTRAEFRQFMFEQSSVIPKMVELMIHEKKKKNLKIVAFNNEALELNEHRIQKFGLNQWIDFFVSSCYVHLRKPATELFQLALNMAQVPREEVLYIDNTALFIEFAQKLEIPSFLHRNYSETRAYLQSYSYWGRKGSGAGRKFRARFSSASQMLQL
jgi:putative hydrolase of the HAD superfamily